MVKTVKMLPMISTRSIFNIKSLSLDKVTSGLVLKLLGAVAI